MTTSRTDSGAVKCVSTCGVAGISISPRQQSFNPAVKHSEIRPRFRKCSMSGHSGRIISRVEQTLFIARHLNERLSIRCDISAASRRWPKEKNACLTYLNPAAAERSGYDGCSIVESSKNEKTNLNAARF